MSDTEEDPRAEARVLYTLHGAGRTPVREWGRMREAIVDEVASIGALCDTGWARREEDAFLVLAELTEVDLWACRDAAHRLAIGLESVLGDPRGITLRRVDLDTPTCERAEAES